MYETTTRFDERKQFFPGPGIAALDGFEEPGDVTHGRQLAWDGDRAKPKFSRKRPTYFFCASYSF